MANFPLTGLRVLDLSRVVAGPFATRMLSDLGADVLKVEPPEGDVTRHMGKPFGEMSGSYLQQNIGKRNICIDMKMQGARDLILRLAAKADLVVENFRPGVMERFGLAWADLSAVNRKLVMLSISGFGQDGPERSRAAYAPVLHAETGLLARQARAIDGPTGDIQFSMADTYSGLHGLVAALAALRLSDQTGKGQHIDIAMLNVMHATDDYAHLALDDAWAGRPDENRVWDAPENNKVLITGNMKWIWHVYSTRGVLTDPTPPGADLETKLSLRRKALQDAVLAHQTFDDLTAQLDDLNLPWGKVRAVGEDALTQPSIGPRGVFIEVEDETGERHTTVQSPYKFSDADAGINAASRAPRRGEHNLSALQDWIDLSEDEVAALQDAGVLLAEDGL